MSSTKFWALAGLVVLAGAAAWSARTPAQPFPRPEMPGFTGPMSVGRYAVARADGTTIIILDTVTGDLYKATEKDLKDYKSRPKMGGPSFPTFPKDFKFPTFPKDITFPKDFPPKDFKFPTPPKDVKLPVDFSKFFPKDGKKAKPPEVPEKKEE
jgi:hypothetical protein